MLSEVKPFLSRAGRGPFIIALVGVIVDDRRRPVKPLFELADCGSLEDYIKRGWEALPAGVCVCVCVCVCVRVFVCVRVYVCVRLFQ